MLSAAFEHMHRGLSFFRRISLALIQTVDVKCVQEQVDLMEDFVRITVNSVPSGERERDRQIDTQTHTMGREKERD